MPLVRSEHYYNRYTKFISECSNQTVSGYSEKHHIVPVSLGGSDDKENLVTLTARQHYIAHWMLWKAYGGSMTAAFFQMSNLARYSKRNTSRIYSSLKEERAKLMSERMMGHTPWNKGVAMTDEVKLKISKNRTGIKPNDTSNYSLAKLGVARSEEAKQKISQSHIGIKQSLESLEKMKATKKANPTGTGKWMNNGLVQKKIKLQDVDKYVDDGWALGTLRTHITPEYRNNLSTAVKKQWESKRI
jgi:hypothetical protein